MATTMKPVIGERTPKVAAVEIVEGRAQYAADVRLPGMLYGAVLRSPWAHAHVKAIDTSKAMSIKGVKGVITGRDMPEVKAGVTFHLGDIPVPLEWVARMALARDRVLYHGHAVAAVAATDPDIAREAAEAIEVEYEALEPVPDLETALREDAPLVDPNLYTHDGFGGRVADRPSNVNARIRVDRGDVEEGFAQADVVVERTYRVYSAHQGYLEPQACLARLSSDGKVTVWTATQGAANLKAQLATLLGLPLNDVRIIPTEVGGAFGGKIFAILEPLAVLLAQRTGRSVQMQMRHEEVLRATGPGASAKFRVKTGCRRDGTITAMELHSVLESGCVPGAPASYTYRLAVGAYAKIPNLRMEALDVLSNKPRVSPYRAPAAPQVVFAVEQNIDEMARAIGMDPIEFRLKNASDEGDEEVTGSPFNRLGLRRVLEEACRHPHWNAPLPGPNRGRGVALGYWWGATFTSSAHILINRDGTATLVVGSVDITGTRTTLGQIAAQELGLQPHQVTVLVGHTDEVGHTDVSGGSRTTYVTGAAVHRACQDALAQLRDRAASRLGVETELIEFEQGRFFVRDDPDRAATLGSLALGPEGALMGRGTVRGMATVPTFALGIADVEVDPETGKVRVLRYTAIQDVGKAVNPTQVEGQMQGGASQGIGWALTEELTYGPGAVLLNASLLDYREPVALDLPLIDTQIVEVPAHDGPYGIRGVGEVPISHPSGAIANAIADATGVRMTEMPMTPERVLFAQRGASRQG